jgi:hypothetical protein
VRRSPVVARLSGGLGNQLFQYAAGRSLAIRLDTELVLDLSWFGGQRKRKFALSPFRIHARKRFIGSSMPVWGRALVSRSFRYWAPHIAGVPIWREPHFHYADAFSALTRPVYLVGYWQSDRYFREIRADLIKDLSLRDALPSASDAIRQSMRSCDAICVHVRRGDYLTDPAAVKTHGVCSVDYYGKSIREICQGLDRPHCFIFSDDPAWVRTSMHVDCPMTVVDVNGPDDAHLDLALMAACDHFVIANSSLSWWGAWLGNSPGKRVIAPARWFLTPDKNTTDLLPASWRRR